MPLKSANKWIIYRKFPNAVYPRAIKHGKLSSLEFTTIDDMKRFAERKTEQFTGYRRQDFKRWMNSEELAEVKNMKQYWIRISRDKEIQIRIEVYD